MVAIVDCRVIVYRSCRQKYFTSFQLNSKKLTVAVGRRLDSRKQETSGGLSLAFILV